MYAVYKIDKNVKLYMYKSNFLPLKPVRTNINVLLRRRF